MRRSRVTAAIDSVACMNVMLLFYGCVCLDVCVCVCAASLCVRMRACERVSLCALASNPLCFMVYRSGICNAEACLFNAAVVSQTESIVSLASVCPTLPILSSYRLCRAAQLKETCALLWLLHDTTAGVSHIR